MIAQKSNMSQRNAYFAFQRRLNDKFITSLMAVAYHLYAILRSYTIRSKDGGFLPVPERRTLSARPIRAPRSLAHEHCAGLAHRQPSPISIVNGASPMDWAMLVARSLAYA